jgi:hypothetical protein
MKVAELTCPISQVVIFTSNIGARAILDKRKNMDEARKAVSGAPE